MHMHVVIPYINAKCTCVWGASKASKLGAFQLNRYMKPDGNTCSYVTK